MRSSASNDTAVSIHSTLGIVAADALKGLPSGSTTHISAIISVRATKVDGSKSQQYSSPR